MKKLFLSLAVIAATLSASAQTKTTTTSPFRVSLGIDAVAPFGNLADGTSFGIGGSLEGDYSVDNTLALTLNAGYIRFLQKNNNGLKLGVIPVLAGIKYYFTPQFYSSAQLGVGIFTSNSSSSSALTYAPGIGYKFSDGSSSSAFAYAPGIGYKFSDNFDAGVKYQAYSKNSHTTNTGSLRLAYTF